MQRIELPWAAWYGDTKKVFEIPDDWQISVFDNDDNQKISDENLLSSLHTLKSILNQNKPQNALIVVDDLTRPVEVSNVAEIIVNYLNEGGIKDQNIKFLIGLGSHKGLSEEQIRKKIGKTLASRIKCINHNPEYVRDIDVQWGNTKIKLNKHYLESDFRIVISGLTPHSFAGFSGGAKMLFPGLADMETISRTHKSVLMGFMGKLGEVEQNKFRKTIEDFLIKTKIHFFVGLVINTDRSIRNIYCGDAIEAHRDASIQAKQYCTFETDKTYDVIISSAYPKDTELLQAENGFIPLKSSGLPLLKENGYFILVSSCSEGLGHHGLFEPGGLLYRKPRPLNFLKGKHLLMYSENISAEEFHSIYNEEYRFYNIWSELLSYIQPKLSNSPSVAVFPFGSMQLVSN